MCCSTKLKLAGCFAGFPFGLLSSWLVGGFAGLLAEDERLEVAYFVLAASTGLLLLAGGLSQG